MWILAAMVLFLSPCSAATAARQDGRAGDRRAAEISPRVDLRVQPARLFMWKVVSKSSTVYVLGSVHFASKSWYPLPRAIEDAFAASSTLVVEFNIARMDYRKFGTTMETYGICKRDDSLWKHISPETADAFRAFCLRRGANPELLGRAKPWLLAMLIGPQPKSPGTGSPPEMETSFGIDKHLLERAHEKRIEEIESAEAQVKLLESMSDALQDRDLADSLKKAEASEDHEAELRQAWRAGDVEAMAALIARYYSRPPDVDKVIVEGRNRAMEACVEKHLRGKGTTLVVVGAAHLVGPKSILALLEERGYSPHQVTDSYPGHSADGAGG